MVGRTPHCVPIYAAVDATTPRDMIDQDVTHEHDIAEKEDLETKRINSKPYNPHHQNIQAYIQAAGRREKSTMASNHRAASMGPVLRNKPYFEQQREALLGEIAMVCSNCCDFISFSPGKTLYMLTKVKCLSQELRAGSRQHQ